jgi:Zn-dependent peptidase ImmA (M78 family)
MSEAFITPANLAWARSRAGLSREELAARAVVPLGKLGDWEEGEARPTMRQAESLAASLHIPLGYLFLSDPPRESPSIPDFRAGYAGGASRMSLELRETIDAAARRQEAYRELLEEDGAEPLSFVGSFDAGGEPEKIAADMRAVLGVDGEFARRAKTWSDEMTRLAKAAEGAGILVFRSGIVGGNARRGLSVDEFRGFALCDPFAPVLFVNAADYKAAQIFTIAHELAHVWLGASGVSNAAVDDFTRGGNTALEVICDRAAAEFLLPAESFLSEWRRGAESAEELERLARRYRVSAIVVLRRALDLGLVERGEFIGLLEAARGYRPERPTEGGGGGDFYKTFAARNGERFPAAILGALRGGRLLYREAARLLDVHPGTLRSLELKGMERVG